MQLNNELVHLIGYRNSLLRTHSAEKKKLSQQHTTANGDDALRFAAIPFCLTLCVRSIYSVVLQDKFLARSFIVFLLFWHTVLSSCNLFSIKKNGFFNNLC